MPANICISSRESAAPSIVLLSILLSREYLWSVFLQGIIDDYLTEQLKQSSQPQVHPKRQRSSTPVSDEDDDEENDNKPTKQRKSHTAGNSSSGSYEGAPAGGIMLDTQGLKWVSVSNFKGQQYVNLRNYYRVSSLFHHSVLCHTRFGICDDMAVWCLSATTRGSGMSMIKINTG